MSIEAPVKRQLAAYNARDLKAFCLNFCEDIKVYQPPVIAPVTVGMEAFAEHYRTKRFNLPGLYAEVLNRTIIGDKVFDHERVSVPGEQTREVMVTYQIKDDKIINIWFFA